MDELRQQIEKLLPHGVYLMDLNEDPHRRLVRCFVDSEESITLEVTTEIAKSINNSGLLSTHYPDGASLEVTTLGVSSPLTYPFQFKKNVGRNLDLTYDNNGYRKCTEAELEGFDNGTLYLKNNSKNHFQLELDQILQAKVIIQFK